MSMLLSILLFSLISAAYQINWTEPVLLSVQPNTLVPKILSVHTDYGHNLIHALIISNYGTLDYLRIPLETIHMDGVFRVSFGKRYATGGAIIGWGHDNLLIAVSYNQHDSNNFGTCSPKINGTGSETDGCHDIFIMESDNLGTNWTNPIQITRKDLTTPVHRGSPSILYIPTSGRIFIFYTHYSLDGSKIAYVTRSRDSSLFTSEKIILNTGYINSYIIPQYTIDKSRVLIHLLWTQTDSSYSQHLAFSCSTNLGITWEEPKIIGGGLPETDMLIIPEAGMAALEQENLLFAMFSDNKGTKIMKSADSGKSWEFIEGFNPDRKTIVPYMFKYIKDGKNTIFIIGTDESRNYLSFGYYDHETNKIIEDQGPFTILPIAINAKLSGMKLNDNNELLAIATMLDPLSNTYIGLSFAKF